MMRDEMKSRVLKIAAEKFRLGQNEAITGGKFEFCNSLYINLMEEIHTCIADMFLKVDSFNFCYWHTHFNSAADMFPSTVHTRLMFVCSITLTSNVVTFASAETQNSQCLGRIRGVK